MADESYNEENKLIQELTDLVNQNSYECIPVWMGDYDNEIACLSIELMENTMG